MSAHQDERWIDQHALAFALGELDTVDEARFRGLAEADPVWSGLLEGGEGREVGHVPAALIARWTEAGRELRGVERQLVLDHAQGCHDCREELELLGFDHASWLAPVKSASPRDWWPWFGGAVLGAAAMFAFMMVRTPEPGLHGGELQVVSPRAVRGSDLAALELPADARAFLLATALPTNLAAGTVAVLRVIDPAGQPVSETQLAPPPWSPAATQVLLLGDPGFVSGEYRVELVAEGEDSPRDLGRFRIETSR